MILGRPTPRETRELKERQSQIAAWWTTALECDPSFAPEAMAAIGRAIDLRNQPAPELSLEDREHLTRLRDAIVNGPEALYLHLRVRPSGKRDNEQNIFRRMRSHFSMTFREFKTLANRLEKEYPQ